MDVPAPRQPDEFLDTVIHFDDGTSYERLQPITDYRRDPGEARILYICRKVSRGRDGAGVAPQTSEGEEFVMKVKVQSVPSFTPPSATQRNQL